MSEMKMTMRPNRWMSLAVAGMMLLAVVSGCRRGSTARPEIAVTPPPRAMNEEVIDSPLPGRPPRPTTVAVGTTQPVEETAVAQAPTAASPEPTPVAVTAKPQAAPATRAVAVAQTPAPSTRVVEPAPQAVASKHGRERSRIVSQSDEIVSVLENGMTVIAKRMPSPVLAVRGYVWTGGVYEGRWLGGGLSHLLEHLVAGGSSQRRNEAENRDLLQRIGNDSNAYTTDDHTAYFINTTPDHLEPAVDLITGWLFGALITEDEYRREYEVVQRELEKGKGEPGRQFYYLAQRNRYRVSPVRVPVIGYQEVIQGLSRDDVFSYFKETYVPNNMIFSICGDLEPQAMLQAVQKFVDDVPPGRVPSKAMADEPAVLSPRTVVATFPKLGQARLQLEFPSVKLTDPDLYALDLLSTILGGGESSILVQELRDKRRLVTSVYASNPTPSYVAGSFEIQMMLPPDKIAEATKVALEIVENIVQGTISEDQILRAKAQMRAARVRSLQTSESMAASLANDLMSAGDPHFTDRYLKRIDQLTVEDLKFVAASYFIREKLVTTAMLPAEYVGAAGLPKAEDLLRPVAPTTRDTIAATTQPVVTRTELANGVILLHKRIATLPLVEVRSYALGGLTIENADSNGIGNLTMQMLPRGTKSASAQQIAEFFDSIGGTLDTGCGNNSWFWNMTCLKDDFAKAMEVYGDVVANPSFNKDELAQMQERVIAGIESQDADWHTQAMRFFKQAYFGPMNSPYQFMTIGQKPVVEKLTPEQLSQFYHGKVLQARRVVAIYGDVDLATAEAAAKKHFAGGDAVSKEAPKPQPPDDTLAEKLNRPTIEVARVEVQETEQPVAGVIIGYDSQSVIGDDANYPIAVADTMSSGFGYPTGYLHETLRGRGLVYVVHAVNQPGRSVKMPGTFLVYAGCDPTKVNEVVDLILENIARLQGSDADMNASWFQRSKQLAITSDALQTETPAEQATQAALDELYGLGYAYHDQFARRIESVKLNEVRDLAKKRLRRCVITISTPNPGGVNVKTGKRTYNKLPPVDLTPRGVQHDAAE